MNLATAIVVARGGSVRLPNKALLPFAGTTLLGHKVRTLRACPRIGRVVVGSDSDPILDEAARHGAEPVANLDYYNDTRRMISDTIDRVPGLTDDNVVLWAHPTNPLVSADTYAGALDAYERAIHAGTADSLASVYEVRRHAWLDGQPINHSPWDERHALAANLTPVLFQDGAIFIQTAGRFSSTRYFYGENPLLYVVPSAEVGDIDTAEDLKAARAALCGQLA